MEVDVKITIDIPENPELADLIGAFLDATEYTRLEDGGCSCDPTKGCIELERISSCMFVKKEK